MKFQVPYFEEMHSIEASERYFAMAQENLLETDVNLHFGESPKILESLLPKLQEKKSLFS